MAKPGAKGWKPSAKTITNKHGFLAGALNAAVAASHIPANPCTGMGMPKNDDPREAIFLTREEYALLHSMGRQPWISQSCKQGADGYRLGSTKTKKGVRTINVPKSVLDKLDFSNEFLFVNRAGGPVRAQGFFARVWVPALKRAWRSVDGEDEPVKGGSKVLRPRIHDLRHTCASWMIQAGVPLPVIQQHLGHKSIQTTVAVYGHLDRRSMQAAADAIGRALEIPGVATLGGTQQVDA
jgi:integrase